MNTGQQQQVVVVDVDDDDDNHDDFVSECILDIHTWLHTIGVDIQGHEFIDAYCNKLIEVGIPLNRLFCGASVMHPLVAARAWKWLEGTITDFSWSRMEVANRSEWEDTYKGMWLLLLLL